MHPVLRAARVLDAGACALLVVLDALARAVGDERPVHVPLDWLPTTAAHHASVEPTGGAYEVMLLVSDDGAGDGAAVDTGAELRRRMGALGDSVAVVGGDGWWHVHVHTDQPTAAIAAAALGRREQVLVRLLAGAHAGGSALHDRADGRERWGVVVCTAAPDLAAWYAAAGAVVARPLPRGARPAPSTSSARSPTRERRTWSSCRERVRRSRRRRPSRAWSSRRSTRPTRCAPSSGRWRWPARARRRRVARRRRRRWPVSASAPSRPRPVRAVADAVDALVRTPRADARPRA